MSEPSYDPSANMIQAKELSPVDRGIVSLTQAISQLEDSWSAMCNKLSPVTRAAEPESAQEPQPGADYPGTSPVVRQLSELLYRVEGVNTSINRHLGKLEI